MKKKKTKKTKISPQGHIINLLDNDIEITVNGKDMNLKQYFEKLNNQEDREELKKWKEHFENIIKHFFTEQKANMVRICMVLRHPNTEEDKKNISVIKDTYVIVKDKKNTKGYEYTVAIDGLHYIPMLYRPVDVSSLDKDTEKNQMMAYPHLVDMLQ